jgi:hypothetical protein
MSICRNSLDGVDSKGSPYASLHTKITSKKVASRRIPLWEIYHYHWQPSRHTPNRAVRQKENLKTESTVNRCVARLKQMLKKMSNSPIGPMKFSVFPYIEISSYVTNVPCINNKTVFIGAV